MLLEILTLKANKGNISWGAVQFQLPGILILNTPIITAV
jgi:hypothetical protein